jgi:hypothetical protein
MSPSNGEAAVGGLVSAHTRGVTMNRWLSSAAVLVTAAALASAAPAAAAPPDDGGGTVTADGLCPFTVTIDLTGKAKTIEHPSPG